MAVLTGDELAHLQVRFENAYPQDILRWAAITYGSRLALVTSFQPTGIVTAHMLSEIAPRTPVLTIDTGLLFPETYQLMDALEARLNINLRRVRPRCSVEQQAAVRGPALWQRDPDTCCRLRKVEPLNAALTGFDAWIAGLRRDQSSGRAHVPVMKEDSQRPGMLKLAPLATWTEDMVWSYIHAYDLPYNELHDRGYPSIGCWPCTQPVQPGDDKRAGRWSGHAKTECGINIDLPEEDAGR